MSTQPEPGTPDRDRRQTSEPSGYQRNAEFGYHIGRDLLARAEAETDPQHQRRLLRRAEENLGWAQVNDQLEQARRIVDAIDIDTVDDLDESDPDAGTGRADDVDREIEQDGRDVGDAGDDGWADAGEWAQ